MKAVLRLSFAILAFAFALPERGYSEETRQWVQHFDEYPRLVAKGYGWYDIEHSCAVGWLYSDGSFDERFRDDGSGIYRIFEDYSDAWDFAKWRTDKYIISADHGSDFEGFTSTRRYLFDGSYYVGLTPYEDDYHETYPIWRSFHDAAGQYYHHYMRAGYPYLAAACYCHYYFVGDYYMYYDAREYDEAYYCYYYAAACYHYYYHYEFANYQRALEFYVYYLESANRYR